jgi:hypothetical protein
MRVNLNRLYILFVIIYYSYIRMINKNYYSHIHMWITILSYVDIVINRICII